MPKVVSSQIRSIVIRHRGKGWTADKMRRQLAAALQQGRLKGELPSERWIQDVWKKAKDQPVGDHYAIAVVEWPASFEQGLLPWEASPSYFELRKHFWGGQPLLPAATWFHRMTLIVPQSPVQVRSGLALAMALAECVFGMLSDYGRLHVELVDLALQHRPWESAGGFRRFMWAAGCLDEKGIVRSVVRRPLAPGEDDTDVPIESWDDYKEAAFTFRHLLDTALAIRIQSGLNPNPSLKIDAETALYCIELESGVNDLDFRTELLATYRDALDSDTELFFRENMTVAAPQTLVPSWIEDWASDVKSKEVNS